MKKFKINWSFGNSKLKKDGIVSFGLPALRSFSGFVTCPQAGACASVCYARQGMYVMPNVRATRESNLNKSQESDFVQNAIDDLGKIKQKLIRVHDSGDFYNQAYLDKWIAIAVACPEKVFYAYTKSLHLDFSRLPANFRIVQSCGGKLDAMIDTTKSHSRIFATETALAIAGYQDGSKSDELAINGIQKIGLVYHGSKKLSDKQIDLFV